MVSLPKTFILRGTAILLPTCMSPNCRQPLIVKNGCVIVVSIKRPNLVVTRNTGLIPSSIKSDGLVR